MTTTSAWPVGWLGQRRLKRAIERRAAELAARYGAHHIGVSKKYRAGSRTPRTCITFYVKKKGSDVARQVPRRIRFDRLYPSRLLRLATDVCEIGELKGLALRGGHLVAAGDGETGTVGLVLRQAGRDLFLTNAHVATDPGLPAGQLVATVPGIGLVGGMVAVIDDLTAPVIRSDAALVLANPGSVAPGEFHQVPLRLKGCGEFLFNDPRRFFYVAQGVEHELRYRGFVPDMAEIWIDGFLLIYASFHKLDVLTGQCRPGDSGAVVFCKEGATVRAVGLLFGGDEEANEILAFPVRRCLKQMGINPDSL